ncbi:Electron transport complex subunit RnfC [bioreactor metagenome]|uniref:Electron transport complex subunit RnfC n=1 Tax=bioreactor metagenome TaxID=1076179 RepID=A0A645JV70_9ZZZZ
MGTTYVQAFEACGGLCDDVGKIFAGGPMTGLCAADTSVSMTKATNGIVAFSQQQAKQIEETACIRCARCAQVCPIGLHPYQMRADIDRPDLELAKKNGLLDCVLCGACSYICPARRYLASSFKAAREELAAKARR